MKQSRFTDEQIIAVLRERRPGFRPPPAMEPSSPPTRCSLGLKAVGPLGISWRRQSRCRTAFARRSTAVCVTNCSMRRSSTISIHPIDAGAINRCTQSKAPPLGARLSHPRAIHPSLHRKRATGAAIATSRADRPLLHRRSLRQSQPATLAPTGGNNGGPAHSATPPNCAKTDWAPAP